MTYVTLAATVAVVVLSFLAQVMLRQAPAGYGEPPVVIWGVTQATSTLTPGQSFRFSYEYAKRAECHPPQGRGTFDFRLWLHRDGAYDTFRVIESADSRSAPTAHAYRNADVPLPTLPPGRYALQYRGAFQCAGLSSMQYVDGPLMEFEVVALRP